MTFAKKIFIAVFLSTLMIGTLLICAAYKYTMNRSEAEFMSRYQVFSKVLADTLGHLDTSTESFMLNAAKVVAEKDAKYGLLSTDKLRGLQTELGVTHLFLTDNRGKFIRSTNDNPADIPNLFSFCDRYKKLITGDLKVEATPIIKPNPEPRPHKFLSIPNHDGTRIVEVGVRVEFIAKTLVEAIRSDKNVFAMSLYAPDGTPFGTYSDQNVAFESQKAVLPNSFDAPVASRNSVSFFTRVTSSHPKCCQCDVAGTSKNGEYYYVLESKVSKAELTTLQAKAGLMFLFIAFGNALFSYALARLLSRWLVKNIETAVSRVRNIKDKGNLADRIGLKTGDEISFLTEEFDRLLDSLEESQRKVVEAEKVQSKIELARVVAHNIRSPIIAIEMMLPGLVAVPERMKRILKNAVTEIKQLSEKLKTQSESMATNSNKEMDTDLVFLPIFLDELVRQKNMEFSSNKKTAIVFSYTDQSSGLFVKASSVELRSVISNIINNSSESYGIADGDINVALSGESEFCVIKVSDRGAGIPASYLTDLGKKSISFKGSSSRGLGLIHAFKVIESWNGKIEIESTVGVGTCVEIKLRQYCGDNGATTNLIGPGSTFKSDQLVV